MSDLPPPPPPPPPPPFERSPFEPPGGAQPQLAEWWQRAVAAIIDFVVLAIANRVLDVIFRPVIAGLLGLVLGIAYYGYMNGEMGQTVGKMVMKLRVVGEDTGTVIGLGPGIARYLVSVALWLALCVGGIVDALFPLWDPKRQTIHDKAVRSLVVVSPA